MFISIFIIFLRFVNFVNKNFYRNVVIVDVRSVGFWRGIVRVRLVFGDNLLFNDE